MLTISSDQTVFQMSAGNSPAARARSGDTVLFETLDCFGCQIQRDDQLLSGIDWDNINPATGPLYVEEAQPGDLLKVEIRKICLAERGVMTCLPENGVFGGILKRETTKILPIENGTVRFDERISLPVRPMIGVIGTAPAGEPVATGTPGEHGGNMDCKRIGENTVLYLPVQVKGALLAMGDLHAVMGDGEVVICGVEIAGSIAVRVSVIKGADLPTPFLVTGRHAVTICSDSSLDAAANRAALAMHHFLTAAVGIDSNEAALLLSAAADLGICQVVDPQVTCRMELPIEIVDKLDYAMP